MEGVEQVVEAAVVWAHGGDGAGVVGEAPEPVVGEVLTEGLDAGEGFGAVEGGEGDGVGFGVFGDLVGGEGAFGEEVLQPEKGVLGDDGGGAGGLGGGAGAGTAVVGATDGQRSEGRAGAA